jgi:hypothetical protein
MLEPLETYIFGNGRSDVILIVTEIVRCVLIWQLGAGKFKTDLMKNFVPIGQSEEQLAQSVYARWQPPRISEP